ncbi:MULTISPECIES: hypothetical protein [Thermus]|uniref:Tsp509I n=1 Tax=Thermus sp. ITI 346 TaxID=1046940 RepID=G3JXC8_9DEIN|nr:MULTISPECIES: hypothetical protein [Thermus]AEN19711.1 Tsp509I [Thermus sp. ITI 346]
MNEMYEIAKGVASFEGAPTLPGRTTGEARGGREFEAVVAEGLLKYGRLLVTAVPSLRLRPVAAEGTSRQNHLADALAVVNEENKRVLVFRLPAFRHNPLFAEITSGALQNDFVRVPDSFLKREFVVEEWYTPKLGELAERGWIPEEDEPYPFSGTNYPELYRRKRTQFDGVIIFLESGTLREKALLEIKSLKSSEGARVDGNAHERFAYQNLDYLEIGALYPRTTLLLLTNDAILKYRNKYHTGIGVHALRLSYAFCWYKFEMVSSVRQYLRLFSLWKEWLEGK